MKFVWAFLIVITCLIPFLIGAGFGLDALLGYCSSNSDCRNYEVCRKNKCTDECAQAVCNDNEYCHMKNGVAICECRPGFLFNQNTQKCEQNVYCTNTIQCDSTSICKNNTCIDICSQTNCGQLEVCEVSRTTGKPTCTCQPHYRRHPQSVQCVKRCLHDEDCDDTEVCFNKKWCDTPCIGPIPPHTHCVPRGHEPTYNCDRCYRPTRSGNACELDTSDASCLSRAKSGSVPK